MGLLIIIALISGCQKSDSKLSSDQLMIGKWKVITESNKDYENNVLSYANTQILDYDVYLIFRSDGTYKIDNRDPQDSFTEDGVYEIEGDEISIHPVGRTEILRIKIKELSPSALIIEETYIELNRKSVTTTSLTKVGE